MSLIRALAANQGPDFFEHMKQYKQWVENRPWTVKAA